jgi:hypothetical protein
MSVADRRASQAPSGAWARPRSIAASIAPAAVVGCLLIVLAAVYYVRFDFGARDWGGHVAPSAVPVWLAFNDLGYKWATIAKDSGEAVPLSGYDGQFYFYMARDPGIILQCAQVALPHCAIDASPLREERILYPMTARLLTGGDPAALHVALFLIDFAAILLTVVLVGLMCVEAGASRWLAVAAGAFIGEVQGLLRDLADPYAVFWAVLAVYLLRKRRPLLTGLAVAAAVLTREQLVLVLPLLGLPWLARRRWSALAAFLAAALGPFLAWQTALFAIYHRFGFTGSVATTRGLRWPFMALLEHPNGDEFTQTILFVVVPLLAAALVAVLWVRRNGLRAISRDPVPLIVVLYCLLASLTAYAEWADTWASARLIAPAAVLALILAATLAPRLRNAYAGLLGATALAMFVIVPVLY